MKVRAYFIGEVTEDKKSLFINAESGLYRELEGVEEIIDFDTEDILLNSIKGKYLCSFDKKLFRLEIVPEEK